jgi:putative restriction endonuclease
MRFWWVNQNQTFEHEVGDGYLWSPKTNKNGARNQFYENMRLVERGDLVFSYSETKIKRIGIAQGPAYESQKPKAFGNVGDYWNEDGWKVDVSYERLTNENIRPKDYMDSIIPHLPKKYSPLQINGNGIQSVYLAEITVDLAELLIKLTGAPELVLEVETLEELTHNPEEEEILLDESLTRTVMTTLVQARRGQGEFRKRVHAIEIGCRVTQVTAEKLLIASHIKPWSKSDNAERLSGNNGLFLSPHVDALFDKGFISFTKSGEVLVSPQLEKDVLSRWKIDPIQKVGKFNSEQAYFLEHHNEQVFKAS